MKKEPQKFKRLIPWAGWMVCLILFLALSGCGPVASGGASAESAVVLVVPTEIFPAYTGEVQGVVLSANISARILTASLPANRSMMERAFELDQLVRAYPAGTVFLVFGNGVPGREGLPIVLKTKAGRILVGPDSGVFTRILEREEVESFAHITATKSLQGEGLNSMFPERDVYAPVAADLVQGTIVSNFGEPGTNLVRVPIPKATVAGPALNGEVLFVSWSGRVVTNFRVETFQKVKTGDLIRLNASGKPFTVPYLTNENEAPPGRPFGICNADGFFEIAVLDANAAQVLKLIPGQKITIR
jgi:S-adenosylmethionine hydrolase